MGTTVQQRMSWYMKKNDWMYPVPAASQSCFLSYKVFKWGRRRRDTPVVKTSSWKSWDFTPVVPSLFITENSIYYNYFIFARSPLFFLRYRVHIKRSLKDRSSLHFHKQWKVWKYILNESWPQRIVTWNLCNEIFFTCTNLNLLHILYLQYIYS